MYSGQKKSSLTLPQGAKLTVFIAVCLIVFERVSSVGQQLPPDWSQHYHDGQIYYYDSRTGTTQWDAPIIPSQADLYDEKIYHDEQLATSTRNSDDQNFLQQGPIDPWTSVNVEDEFDAVMSGSNDDRRFREENNGDFSDDENWYDDETRQLQHPQTLPVKGSKVSRTFNDFKTSFSSLKSMLKVKARKKKLELFGSASETQQNRITDDNYNDDFASPAPRYKGQDIQNTADVQERIPSQQQQEQRQKQQEQQQQQQQQEGRHVVQDSFFNRDNIQKKTNRPGELQHDTPISQEKQQQTGSDKGAQHQHKIDVSAGNQQMSPGQVRKQTLVEESSSHKTGKNYSTERERNYDMDKKMRKKESQAVEKSAFVPSSEKISVHLMGKADDNLWADYVDDDDVAVFSKKNSRFVHFKLSEEGTKDCRRLFNFKFFAGVLKGCAALVGSVSGSLTAVVPLMTRIALSMLFISIASAPLQMLLLLTLTVAKDVLVPLALVSVMSTVQYVQDTSIPIPAQSDLPYSIKPSVDRTHERILDSSLLSDILEHSSVVLEDAKEHSSVVLEDVEEHSSVLLEDVTEHSSVLLEDAKILKLDSMQSDDSALLFDKHNLSAYSNLQNQEHSLAEERVAHSTQSNVPDEGSIDKNVSGGLGESASAVIGISDADADADVQARVHVDGSIFMSKDSSSSSSSSGDSSSSIGSSSISGPGSFDTMNTFKGLNFNDLNPLPLITPATGTGTGDQTILTGNDYTFSVSGLLIAVERLFRRIVRGLQETLRLVRMHPGSPALIKILAVSVILSGIVLPLLKRSIGAKIVTFIQKRKHEEIYRSADNDLNRYGQLETNSAIQRDLYANDDDEDLYEDEYEESPGVKGVLISKAIKFKKLLFRGKKHGRSSSSLDSKTVTGGGSYSDSNGWRGRGRGMKGHVERTFSGWDQGLNKLSKNVLCSPVDMLASVFEGYLASLYLVLTLFFISLLSIDTDLKLALSLPYVTVLFLSTVEPYINRFQPQRPAHPSSENKGGHPLAGSGKDESSRLAYLTRILQTRESVDELKKWNLLEQIEILRTAEEARVTSEESVQNQLEVGLSGDSGRVVVDSENWWSTFFLSGRMTLSTVVVAVLSVRPVLHIIETYIEGGGKGRVKLDIFSRIAVIDLSSAAQETLSPFKSNEIFIRLSASVRALIPKIREIPNLIHEFLSGYGFEGFEYPSFIPNLQLHEWNLDQLMGQLGWQKGYSNLWVPQIIVLGALSLGPLLLWHRAMSSTSNAVCAVGDVVTVGEALDDPNFNAAFPRLFTSQGNSLPRHGADPSGRDPFGVKGRDREQERDRDQEREGGWTVDGPNKALGVQLKHLNLMKGGKSSIKGLTVSFPAQSITVILSAKSHSSPASKSIQSDILQAIWGSYSSLPVSVLLPSQELEAADPKGTDKGTGAGTGSGYDRDRVQVEGLVCVHGRDMSEWSLKALRERITFMKEGDLDFSLPAGLLAGTHMLDAGNGFKERILQEVTNLKDFYLSLPFGAATIVGSKKEGEVHVLSAGERRSLSLSRALRHLHRDIILLEGPCDHLSESQERSLFQLIRAEMGQSVGPDGTEGKGRGNGMGKGKVVIITASRFATALHADRVLVMVDGRVGQDGTYKELISQPGPFRDQLFPSAL